MKAIGCDVLALQRFNKILNAYDEAVLTYLFTANELDLAKASSQSSLLLAICFSGKEAVSKALGHGMAGMSWRDIEIFPSLAGTAKINVYKKAKYLADLGSMLQWQLAWKLVDNLIFVLVDVF